MTRYYHFTTIPKQTEHGIAATRLLHDTADDFGTESDMAEMRIRAKVQSGDYLATLLTELDRISTGIGLGAEAAAIEAVVTELVYIDQHYRLTKRPPGKIT